MERQGRIHKKVLIDGTAVDEILIWDGDSWVPGDILTLISEVDDGTAAGQMLFWTGAKWTYTETTELFWDDTTKQLTAAGLILSSLTETRVLFAGVGGIISDDAGLTYASATDILTAGTFNATDEDDILQVDGTTVLKTWALADQNICIGARAGDSLTDGSGINNTFIGTNAGQYTTTGDSNFALGTSALRANTTFSNNVAIGNSALAANNQQQNIAIGTQTMLLCKASFYNVAIGFKAGYGTTGQSYSQNVMIGKECGEGLTTGSSDVIIGTESGRALTSGNFNVFLGYKSGRRQTTNSNLLIIDNQDRTSAALELTDSLIYGAFHDIPASQTLRFNAGSITQGNPTHSDADGGGATQQIFVREDGTGTPTSMFQFEASHDGIVEDDQLGRGTWSRNTGAGLVEAMRIDVDGTKFGGTTNFLQIDDSGIVALAGTAKRVLTLRPEINVDEIKKQAVPHQVQVPEDGIFFGYSMPIWTEDSHEELFFRENVPGRWDGASDITFHILVALNTAQPAATRYFKYALDWNQVGDDEVVPAAVHNFPVEQTVPASTAQYTTYELTFTITYDVDGGDPIAIHDLLAGRLRRIAATTGDEITGEVIVLDWHTHYTVDKMFKAT